MPFMTWATPVSYTHLYYFDPKELEIKEGEFVIVETARGVECGEVVRSAHAVSYTHLDVYKRQDSGLNRISTL